MPELTLLAEYGYLIVLVWVVADQAGLPIPAIPVLLAAGVLSGTGSLDLVAVCGVATFAAMGSDLAWYAVGRSKGIAVLKALCRLSMEPDFCVRQAAFTFQRYGVLTLLTSNFIPGLQTIAPPLAGVSGISLPAFFGLRLVGTIVWVLVFVLPGYFLADRAAELLGQSAELMTTIGISVAVGLAGFVTYKFARRQWFLRAVRVGSVHPQALHDEFTAGTAPHIVDLRSRRELEALPEIIPGATVIPVEEIDDHIETLRQKRDLVLYCT
ncbi:MAG: VTT domain-containing protein [Gammaproteobacteria bacterium]|nr:VTT domain-containing protein [Gammaproteobacteria bacterium]